MKKVRRTRFDSLKHRGWFWSTMIIIMLIIAVGTVLVNINHRHHYFHYYRTGSGILYQTHYLSGNGKRSPKGLYKTRITYSQIKRNQHGTFIKTKYGWINRNALNEYLIAHGQIHYRMRVIHNGSLFNHPGKTDGAKRISSTKAMHLKGSRVSVDGCADTNIDTGYYRFNYHDHNYWILGKNLMFNLSAEKRNNHKLEKIISLGESMVGHSSYDFNTNTRHYDCSSFIQYLYSKINCDLDANTFNQVSDGRRVDADHMKRGDIIFFDDNNDGHLAHVGMYLGNGLILHDTPDSDTRGVDVSSLRDPMWSTKSKYGSVHHFDGIVRRIID